MLIRGASMSLLWGLINSLQISVRSPLMFIAYPSNAESFFSTLFVVTNFDIIPSQTLNTYLFRTNMTMPRNLRFETLDIF